MPVFWAAREPKVLPPTKTEPKASAETLKPASLIGVPSWRVQRRLPAESKRARY
jgi:hypothetical protein